MASILKVDQIRENTIGSGVNIFNQGSPSSPTLSIGSQTNKGLYDIGTDRIGISVAGTQVGEIGPGYGGFTGSVIRVARKIITPIDFTITSIIPRDTTPPQINEGGSVVQVNYTPKMASSSILIQANFWMAETTNVINKFTAALFINDVCVHAQSHGAKDGTNPDLGVFFIQDWITHNGNTLDIEIRADSQSGISVNPQALDGTAGTLYGSGTTRFGGGLSNSELIIWEIMTETL